MPRKKKIDPDKPTGRRFNYDRLTVDVDNYHPNAVKQSGDEAAFHITLSVHTDLGNEDLEKVLTAMHLSKPHFLEALPTEVATFAFAGCVWNLHTVKFWISSELLAELHPASIEDVMLTDRGHADEWRLSFKIKGIPDNQVRYAIEDIALDSLYGHKVALEIIEPPELVELDETEGDRSAQSATANEGETDGTDTDAPPQA